MLSGILLWWIFHTRSGCHIPFRQFDYGEISAKVKQSVCFIKANLFFLLPESLILLQGSFRVSVSFLQTATVNAASLAAEICVLKHITTIFLLAFAGSQNASFAVASFAHRQALLSAESPTEVKPPLLWFFFILLPVDPGRLQISFCVSYVDFRLGGYNPHPDHRR